MMLLPAYYFRRAWLRAFWISSVLVLLLLSTVGWLVSGYGLPITRLWIGGAALLAIGFLFPPLIRLPYFAFRSAGMLLSGLTCSVLALVCYFGLLLPMSAFDRRRLRGEPPAWREWSSSGPPTRTSPLRGSATALRSVIPAFREPWELTLAPFIYLSRLFGGNVEFKQRSDTYTLY